MISLFKFVSSQLISFYIVVTYENPSF